MKNLEGSIVTYTGRRFWPLEPDPELINPLDIAHALSQICRFTGHTRELYSVGNHSCLVHDILPQEHKLWGLLHDASEAYLADLAAPIKDTIEMSFFVEAENRIMTAVCERFGIDPEPPRDVKWADKVLFMTEIRDLMPQAIISQYSPNGHVPLETTIMPWSQAQAKFGMIDRFEKLGIEVKG